MNKKLIVILIVIIISFFGCKSEDSSDESNKTYITGKYTSDNNATIPERFFYVYLDEDTSTDNGYIKRVKGEGSSTDLYYNFSIDTSDVAPGSYYLYGGHIYNPPGTDSYSESDWHAFGWYDSTVDSYTKPVSANISDLDANYIMTGYDDPAN